MDHMTWAIPLITCLASIITLYSSKPKIKLLAFLSVFFTVILGLFQSYESYKTYKINQSVKRYVYSKLENSSKELIILIRSINFQSTDGWIPYNDEDFFSYKTADNICNHLNLGKKAPIFPQQDWISYITQITQKIKSELSGIIDSYPAYLDIDTIIAIDEMKSSFILNWPIQRKSLILYENSVKKDVMPPVMCFGFEKNMEKSLQSLRHLYDLSIKKTEKKHFQHDNGEYKNSTGIARFSEDELEKWVTENPNYKIHIGEKTPF